MLGNGVQMIDLKRNKNKMLVPAKGKRVLSSSIYTPNQKRPFKISRGKFNDFLTCKRCFYLDRVMGFEVPSVPGWTLNETTDLLLKKEFDDCRKKQKPHRLFVNNGLRDLIPFDHPDIDKWRDALRHGLMYRYKNIILTGGIDDVWQHKTSKKLIIADYKSQAKLGPIDRDTYLADPYHSSYKIQMDFYAFLLKNMQFDVDETAYFLVCNARRDRQDFRGIFFFDEVLVPYRWDDKWIPEKVNEMIDLMNQHEVPMPNDSCKNCAYSEQYANCLYPSFHDEGFNF